MHQSEIIANINQTSQTNNQSKKCRGTVTAPGSDRQPPLGAQAAHPRDAGRGERHRQNRRPQIDGHVHQLEEPGQRRHQKAGADVGGQKGGGNEQKDDGGDRRVDDHAARVNDERRTAERRAHAKTGRDKIQTKNNQAHENTRNA